MGRILSSMIMKLIIIQALEYMAKMYICIIAALNNNYSTGNGLYDVGCSHLSISMFGNALVENCTFSNGSNAATYGSTAISVSSMNDLEPHLTFRNNLIYNNTVLTDATVRLESRGGADIYNCTFVNNEADVAALQVEGYEVNIANCIFDNDTPYEITFHDWTANPVETTVNIDHCNIKGGESAVYVPELEIYTLNWLDGNIDAPPDWAEYNEDDLFPYRLPDDDLGIDAGRADTTGMYLPMYDLIYHDRVIDGDQDGAARIDMGCYEYDPYPVVEEEIPRYESGLTNLPESVQSQYHHPLHNPEHIHGQNRHLQHARSEDTRSCRHHVSSR